MAVTSSPEELARAGALYYVDLCATAVRIQEDRLLRQSGDSRVDLWLTLVALRNAIRAAELAASVSKEPQTVLDALNRFGQGRAAKQIRDVFEHFDEYFLGQGRLQRQDSSEPPINHYAPKIEMLYDEGTKEVMVRVGQSELRIPDATRAAEDLLWDVRKPLGG